MELVRLLAHRRWLWRDQPFPHVAARDVFVPSLYREQEQAFQALLARGVGAPPDGRRFSRSMSDYDAFCLTFAGDTPEPFRVFVSRAWHDLIAGLFELRATGDVDGGFHHHAVGSASGWCHNDLNPGWFAGPANADGIRLSDARLCRYPDGASDVPGLERRETVRAAAVIFYLNNRWSPGDGGETGLYRDVRDPVDRPAIAVPPIDNSLVAFECTPASYHAFLSNRRRPRNSVIMWLHRPVEEAIARWGEQAIVRWQGRARPELGARP